MESLTTKNIPSVTKYHYKHNDFLKHIKMIVEWSEFSPGGFRPFQPDMIVSINRGGLVPGVYLSHALDKPHYPIHYQTRDDTPGYHDKSSHDSFLRPPIYNILDKDKNILLVDDINDTGDTFSYIMNSWSKRMNLTLDDLKQQIKTSSLIERAGSKWVVDYSPLILDTNDWVVFPWESKL